MPVVRTAVKNQPVEPGVAAGDGAVAALVVEWHVGELPPGQAAHWRVSDATHPGLRVPARDYPGPP